MGLLVSPSPSFAPFRLLPRWFGLTDHCLWVFCARSRGYVRRANGIARSEGQEADIRSKAELAQFVFGRGGEGVEAGFGCL
jgi:hypothetical protein